MFHGDASRLMAWPGHGLRLGWVWVDAAWTRRRPGMAWLGFARRRAEPDRLGPPRQERCPDRLDTGRDFIIDNLLIISNSPNYQ